MLRDWATKRNCNIVLVWHVSPLVAHETYYHQNLALGRCKLKYNHRKRTSKLPEFGKFGNCFSFMFSFHFGDGSCNFLVMILIKHLSHGAAIFESFLYIRLLSFWHLYLYWLFNFEFLISLELLMQGAQLRKHIDATLGSGNLREAVRLPPGEDLNEWLAVNSNTLSLTF